MPKLETPGGEYLNSASYESVPTRNHFQVTPGRVSLDQFPDGLTTFIKGFGVHCDTHIFALLNRKYLIRGIAKTRVVFYNLKVIAERERTPVTARLRHLGLLTVFVLKFCDQAAAENLLSVGSNVVAQDQRNRLACAAPARSFNTRGLFSYGLALGEVQTFWSRLRRVTRRN
jgi:hypothetical protein